MTKSAFGNHHHHHHSMPPLPQTPAPAPKQSDHRRRWNRPDHEGDSHRGAEPLNLSCSAVAVAAENPDSSDTIRTRSDLAPVTLGTLTGSTGSRWTADPNHHRPPDPKNASASPTPSAPFHHHPGVPLVAASFGLPVMTSSAAKGFRPRSTTTDENRERGDDVIRRQRTNFADQVIGFFIAHNLNKIYVNPPQVSFYCNDLIFVAPQC